MNFPLATFFPNPILRHQTRHLIYWRGAAISRITAVFQKKCFHLSWNSKKWAVAINLVCQFIQRNFFSPESNEIKFSHRRRFQTLLHFYLIWKNFHFVGNLHPNRSKANFFDMESKIKIVKSFLIILRIYLNQILKII